MLLLAFDTATPAVTSAVCEADDGGGSGSVSVRAAASTVDARHHGELLSPQIADVLSRAGAEVTDLTHIAVGIGPGPYTGLRVGLATAHALAEALNVPCHGIPTLDALAFASGREEPFVAATDARRKEVFWARFADARTRTSDIAVDRPSAVDTAGLPVIGHGAHLYADVLGPAAGAEPHYPTAEALGEVALRRLAAGAELDEPRPLYLRRPDAAEPTAPKKVSQWQV
ncbi:tRNA (adenosine(37)-N6)-threonylcarbamoyltransferase complex dimerization subunit type 1 TsaB [Streptomonospora litoralis]|uniref:tRNA threonylcarbamoyladenosine biosynthesis protein TsaB n=1 Tax=Streptomonospora litoralis TaxID=2498135 RepID=A0A4P6PWA4_9ACTN|nr:tRNA (adenosine(37)-N6)-threonylcarbamoyltransferase complex dimerization subunit type 1 TsaB [Streptomonospora litoralis]QBI52353.1 tRNA threonylcarbamoyladenosine biosynthesis protein TsaB [Streptomonospora litoralis]